jgi:tungstate transport system permease protein
MGQLVDGIRGACELILGGDAELYAVTVRTLAIGFSSTVIAAALGIPLGCALGLGRFAGRTPALALANAGIRTPPVALGHLLWLTMWTGSLWGAGPLAWLGWLYSIEAVILAQTLLALPVVVALTASALMALDPRALDQARLLGASRGRRVIFALREAYAGVLTALIAALGVAIASVGAVIIVGTSLGTSTLATAALTRWNSGGQDDLAVAYGTVLLLIFLVQATVVTILQGRDSQWKLIRPS